MNILKIQFECGEYKETTTWNIVGPIEHCYGSHDWYYRFGST